MRMARSPVPHRGVTAAAIFFAAVAAVASGSSASAATLKLFIRDSSGTVYRSDLDGGNLENVFTTPSGDGDIAIDSAAGQIYYGDPSGLYRASLDGSNVQSLLSTVQAYDGIALDLVHGMMYWTEIAGTDDTIRSAHLDGTNDVTILTSAVLGGSVRRIAVDPAGGMMYWTTVGGDTVARANFDGTGVDQVLFGSNSQGIAVDSLNGKVYWTATGTGIQRSNLDGTGLETSLVTGHPSAFGLTLDVAGGKMYWTSSNLGVVYRANLDGSDVETILSGLNGPRSIAIAEYQASVPEPTALALVAVAVAVGAHPAQRRSGRPSFD